MIYDIVGPFLVILIPFSLHFSLVVGLLFIVAFSAGFPVRHCRAVGAFTAYAIGKRAPAALSSVFVYPGGALGAFTLSRSDPLFPALVAYSVLFLFHPVQVVVVSFTFLTGGAFPLLVIFSLLLTAAVAEVLLDNQVIAFLVVAVTFTPTLFAVLVFRSVFQCGAALQAEAMEFSHLPGLSIPFSFQCTDAVGAVGAVSVFGVDVGQYPVSADWVDTPGYAFVLHIYPFG